jgi:hypothetical protein
MKTYKIPIVLLELKEEVLIENNLESDSTETQPHFTDFQASMGCHILVEAKFKGSDQVHYLLIDTGASKTVCDTNFSSENIPRINTEGQIQSSGVNAPIQMDFGMLNNLRLGRLKIDSFAVGLTDLSYVNEVYAKFCQMPIIGMIGGDFLLQYKARIDYEKMLLILKKY